MVPVGSRSCTLIDAIRKQNAVAKIADAQTRRSSSDAAACAMVQTTASEPQPRARNLPQRSLARTARQTALGTRLFAIPISSSIRQADMAWRMSEELSWLLKSSRM